MNLASYNIKYWKLTKKRHEKGRVSSKTLYRLSKQLNIKENNNLNDEIIAQKLTLAYDRYKEIKNKAPQDRKKFLWKLAMAKEQEDGIDASKHIKTLIQVEKQRKQARAITIMRGTKKRTPVLKASYKNGSEIVEVIEKNALESAIIKQNVKKFSQTIGSPTLKGSLLEDIGLLAEKKKVESILNGTYKPKKDVDKYTRMLLKQLKRPDTLEKVETPKISLQDHIEGWKKQ